MMQNSHKQYYNTSYWQKIRESVFKRDNYTCKMCGNNRNLQVHHRTYDELNIHGHDITLTHLVSLCSKCHAQIHSFYNDLNDAVYAVELIYSKAMQGKCSLEHLDVSPKQYRLLNKIGAENDILIAKLILKQRAIVQIADDYIMYRSKEFNSFGDVWFLQNGGQQLQEYITGLMTFDPYNNIQVSWKKWSGRSYADMINVARYQNLYKDHRIMSCPNEKATPRQVAYLERLGYRNVSNWPKAAAQDIIGECKQKGDKPHDGCFKHPEQFTP